MNKPRDDVDELAKTLLRRCADGDQRALEHLHNMFAKRIFAFAFHRLRDDDEARTVVIETMYEVWRSASKFRGDSLVSTWILGIARYKGLNLSSGSAQREFEDINDHVDTLVSEVDDGEEALSKWQQARQVQECMDTLSSAHKECLQLVYIEGLPLAEVAKVQRVPENTIKTRLFHARKNMKLCVEGSAG